MKAIIEVLTEIESQTLTTLESVVAANADAVIQYVDALRQIRDQRLYRAEFKTFAEYCETKWNKSARAIALAIQAGDIRKSLGNGKRVSQMSDRTARSLGKVKPEHRKQVVDEAGKRADKERRNMVPKDIQMAARDYSMANVSHREPPTAPPAPVISPEASLPPVTDPASAADFLVAYYEAHKPWFNDTPNNRPRLPFEILSRFVDALKAS